MSWVRRRLSLLMIRWYCCFFSSARHAAELERLCEEPDEGERRLELVADVRHEVALEPRELELAAHVRPHEGEPGQQHQVDEADEGGLGDGQPPHLLLDRAVAGPELQPHALVGGRAHHALHLERLGAPAARVLVEQLAGGLGHPDHPRPLRVDEAVLEELAHEAPVRVVAGEAEADDPQLLAAHRGEGDRVLLLARRAGGHAGQRLAERPHLRAARLNAAGRDARLRPRLEPERVEPDVVHPRLGEGRPDLCRPSLEQALRPHRACGLERLLARRLLEVLLGVVEQLLGLLQQADLQVLGVLGDGVEGQDAERDRRQQHGPDEDGHDAAARVGDRGEPLLDVRHGQRDSTTAHPAPSRRAAWALRLKDVTG